ncbi:MAG: DUF692 domain-containing protein [Candidatus Obscuribacterales bacterium]|nr:DUF692 domain-containing protein [Candidatus Obscuribacterales bacterium]
MALNFLNMKKKLPVLGIGLGLRRELATETFESKDKIDWLEIVPENYMDLGGMAGERLEQALQAFPLVSHGVNLSIGSTDPLNETYLKSLKKLLDTVDAPWFSDHLCFTSVDGHYLHDLLPLPTSREAVNHVAQRIKTVQEYVQRPFLIENISYYMNMPGCEMSEVQFLAEVLEKADCGLLLDVNNVYVNSINHNFDPYKYLNALPLERTVQMHIAGHSHGDEMIIDTHGNPIIEPVFELLDYVLGRVVVNGVMLERDQNYPEFSEILSELNQIRKVASSYQPQLAKLNLIETDTNGSPELRNSICHTLDTSAGRRSAHAS